MTEPGASPIDQLNALIEFRKEFAAPVDTMGCSKLGDTENEKLYRFQTLIALMLSAQTKDQVTSKAMENLRTLKGGLTPPVLAAQKEETVQELIKQVSFYRNKAERIIKVAGICDSNYDGDIPNTLEKLVELPGVGMKMATLAMGHAWKNPVGIGTDVHVHRIANRLGWVKTNHPDQTEIELQKVFPKELWDPLNETIVGFGQTVCAARKQMCEQCPISGSCKYYRSGKASAPAPRKKKIK